MKLVYHQRKFKKIEVFEEKQSRQPMKYKIKNYKQKDPTLNVERKPFYRMIRLKNNYCQQ